MNKPVKTGAWLTDNYTTVEQLLQMSQEELVAKLNAYDAEGQITGWTLVGTAEVSITLTAPDKIIANKVVALRAELANERAQAEVRCNHLQSQINNLLAIEYKPS